MSSAERLPRISEDFSKDQQEFFDSIVNGPRGKGMVDARGGLRGPFNAMMLLPEISNDLQSLGLAVQTAGPLDAVTLETVILMVSHARNCLGEWNAHLPRAIAAGVHQEQIAAIQNKLPLDAADARLRVPIELTQKMINHEVISDDLFERAKRELGLEAIFQIICVVSYFETLCTIFSTFAIEE